MNMSFATINRNRYLLASMLFGGALVLGACNHPADNANMPVDTNMPASSTAGAPMDNSATPGMSTNGTNSNDMASMKAKADADMQAAKQRCSSMAGNAQTQCMQQAQAAYDAQMKSMNPQQQ